MKFRIVPVIVIALLLLACAPEPGSEGWCEAKKEQPKKEWSMEDAGTFTKHCIVDSLTIGSEEWCEKLADKPKGEWTGDESASYARHCVL